jgi:hypothetical protein
VIEITEYALGRVDVTMSRVDDSSGWFSEITSELEGIHLRACEIARPDPVALARRLFALDVDSEWDILYDAPTRYAEVFGEVGLAELKRSVDERWEALSDADRASAERSHFHLVKIRERLTKASGDVDARFELLAQDLSYPYDYVEIAEVLIEPRCASISPSSDISITRFVRSPNDVAGTACSAAARVGRGVPGP